ncbi:MAG: hypothetical protein HRU26_17965 [Psychroserpens sp.]|nr:hypothetical protein [Psychroserpens sp.]
MTAFDSIFLNVFKHYKTRFKQKAGSVAILYVSALQIGLILLLGAFFARFMKEMHMNTMESWKAWTLFVLFSVGIYFRNWMVYSGKKRNIISAKRIHKSNEQIALWKLWLLLFATYFLALLILNA